MFQWLSDKFAPASVTVDDGRRRDERHAQHGRVVVVKLAGRVSRMRLLNVSTRGASGELPLPASIGQDVVLGFENGLRIAGVVRAVVGRRAGIEFSAPIPLDVVEGERLTRHQGHRRRYPRVRIGRDAVLMRNDETFAAVVDNLSAGGACLRVAEALVPGQQVTIAWANGNRQHGQVRWCGAGAAGVMFAVPTACPVELAREM